MPTVKTVLVVCNVVPMDREIFRDQPYPEDVLELGTLKRERVTRNVPVKLYSYQGAEYEVYELPQGTRYRLLLKGVGNWDGEDEGDFIQRLEIFDLEEWAIA